MLFVLPPMCVRGTPVFHQGAPNVGFIRLGSVDLLALPISGETPDSTDLVTSVISSHGQYNKLHTRALESLFLFLHFYQLSCLIAIPVCFLTTNHQNKLTCLKEEF